MFIINLGGQYFLDVKGFYVIPTFLPSEILILMLTVNRHSNMLSCSYDILGWVDLHTKIPITQTLSIWHWGTSIIALCLQKLKFGKIYVHFIFFQVQLDPLLNGKDFLDRDTI